MTHLKTPGCVPESNTFISPDGNRLLGVAQTAGEDHWPVIWAEGATDPAARGAYDYTGDGPDSPEWQDVEIDGEAAFVDETGDEWLVRHLIPLALAETGGHPETYGLSPDTCALLALDMHLHRQARDAADFHKSLSAEDAANFNTAFIAQTLADRATQAKREAMAAKAADLAIMERGGWGDDEEPKEPVVDIVKMASAGLEHLRQARACFQAAGNVRTAERVRAAISSGQGAVRAAGYRKARVAGN